MTVRHRQHLGVANVELVLAGRRLPFRVLNRDAGVPQRPTGRPDVRLDPGPLQEVVILVVPAGRGQPGVTPIVGLAVGIVVEEEFQLGGGLHNEPHLRRPIDLAPQDRSWRHRYQIVTGHHVAQHEGGPVGPGRRAQGGQVGDKMEIAVAPLPVGVAVAGHRLHLHVDGQQVIAAVGAVADGIVDEEAGVESFAHRSTEMIGEGHDHRVDLTLFHPGPEFALIHARQT